MHDVAGILDHLVLAKRAELTDASCDCYVAFVEFTGDCKERGADARQGIPHRWHRSGSGRSQTIGKTLSAVGAPLFFRCFQRILRQSADIGSKDWLV